MPMPSRHQELLSKRLEPFICTETCGNIGALIFHSGGLSVIPPRQQVNEGVRRQTDAHQQAVQPDPGHLYGFYGVRQFQICVLTKISELYKNRF